MLAGLPFLSSKFIKTDPTQILYVLSGLVRIIAMDNICLPDFPNDH